MHQIMIILKMCVHNFNYLLIIISHYNIIYEYIEFYNQSSIVDVENIFFEICIQEFMQ